MDNQTMQEFFGKPIYSYSRAQAIEDGVLIDLTLSNPQLCKMFFTHNLACTSAVYNIIADASEKMKGRREDYGASHYGASPALYLVLYAAHRAIILCSDPTADSVKFSASVPPESEAREFKLCIGPGDQGEPVYTLMLPDED